MKIKKYTIVDMGTISRGEHYNVMYYKTSTGKIIDEWGFELDVAKVRMYDSYALVLAEIFVGKDRSISYIQGEYNQENLKYIRNIKVKNIYYNMNYEEFVPYYIVVTKNNKVYQVVFETNGHLNTGVKVQEIFDGTTMINEIAALYYNAETFTTMELN